MGFSAQIDRHHVIPRRALKREFPNGHGGRSLRQLVDDERNLLDLRRWHHFQWENSRVRIPRLWLPADAVEFADELGMGWYLDRWYGRIGVEL
jgi:hypothetical protein